MKQICHFLCAFIVLCTAGCAWAGAKTANLFNQVKPVADIAYGTGPFQKLDLYLPENKNHALPVVVFFHGGRWTYGSKEEYAFVAETLVKHGFIVVLPNYTTYPEARFPVFVEDGAKAIAWVHRNILQYNGNPDQIFISGHSSGAHIAALLAANEEYLKTEGANLSIIKGFAGLAGPYAFTPDEPDLKDIFGPPENYPQMQIPTFIDGNEPPMLLLHGLDDIVVGRINADRLEARIRDKGGRVQSIFYPGISHTWIAGALSWLGRSKAPVAQDMVNFFRAHGATTTP